MAFPPSVASRRMEGVHEKVVLRIEGEWIKAAQYLSKKRRNSLDDEREYKEYITEHCFYPTEDTWRIVGIRPVNAGPELLELEITFLNPGRAFELAACKAQSNEFDFHIPDEIVNVLRNAISSEPSTNQ